MYEELERIIEANYAEIGTAYQAINNFCVLAQAAMIDGFTELKSLTERYKAVNPLLHPGARDASLVDITALTYALERLPLQVSQTQELFVRNNLENLEDYSHAIHIENSFRRRTTYWLDDGKLMIVAREGETDIYDILTIMQMYSIEAGKIKDKLSRTGLQERINGLGSQTDISLETRRKEYVNVANYLSVQPSEIASLDKVLEGNLFLLLKNIMTQDTNGIRITFDRELSENDSSEKAHKWIGDIQEHTEKYKGKDVILISSDNHAVVNCLSGFAMHEKRYILSAAKKLGLLNGLDPKEPSTLYYLTQMVSKVDADFHARKRLFESNLGIEFVKDRYHTGINTQIIDVEKLDFSRIDKRIGAKKKSKSPIIINIDYAFGREGKYIMAELCDAFNKRIESISITGKTGIVYGKKYDIILPNAIIPLQGSVYRFTNNLQEKDLAGLISPEKIHTNNPILTVPGTALQSKLVLYYYMQKYKILGLEMEAAPYLEAIEKAQVRNIFRPDLQLKIGHWASDNPLEASENLGHRHMEQGIKSSYALMTAVLRSVLR